MTEVPDTETMKAFNESIVDEFRSNDGKVGGPFEGATILLLTSTGAKSGPSATSTMTPFPTGGSKTPDSRAAWVSR